MLTLSLSRTVAGVLLLSGAMTSHAATLLVTTTADSYDGQCNLHCSLRDAVAVANQAANADIILLPSGTYKLTRPNLRDDDNDPIDEDANLIGDLDVTGELLIKGAGIGQSVIEGLTADLFAVEHRLLEVRPGARLILKQLTLALGRSAESGGAVQNHGHLLLREVQARNNITREWGESDGGYGGAVANYGELVALASQFDSNTAVKEGSIPLGGAIYNSGSLWLRDSHFVRNDLGGLPLSGAGAAVYSTATARIETSSFVDNSAGELAKGGAITNEGGVLTLINSTLSGNREGALTNGRNDSAPAVRSKASLTNVTIVKSFFEIGGFAVMNWGELRIRNSLIAGNHEQFNDAPTNCRNFGANFSYQATGLLRNRQTALSLQYAAGSYELGMEWLHDKLD